MNSTRLVVCVNQRLDSVQKSRAESGSKELIILFKQRFSEADIEIPVVEQVCLGRCTEGVAMRTALGGPFFTQVTELDVDMIVDAVAKFSVKLDYKLK